MPAGVILLEFVLRPIFELAAYGICYWTGYVFVRCLSFGRVGLAPLSTMESRNKKGKWYQVEWSIWLQCSPGKKLLKADFICLLGLVIWVSAGLAIYFATRSGEVTAPAPHSVQAPALDPSRMQAPEP